MGWVQDPDALGPLGHFLLNLIYAQKSASHLFFSTCHCKNKFCPSLALPLSLIPTHQD